MNEKIDLKKEAEKKWKDPSISLEDKLSDTAFASDTFEAISAFLMSNSQEIAGMIKERRVTQDRREDPQFFSQIHRILYYFPSYTRRGLSSMKAAFIYGTWSFSNSPRLRTVRCLTFPFLSR
ncbi:MAG: hypothetical protein PUE57_05460 [Lactimicrobium massiliense]|nr:hypothetical protein [Lactimicrobium massiliense]